VRKGERTRQRAIESAAQVFSTRGYFGTTLEDLTRATGLEKGGLYNHFKSKEQLALEAFDYAVAAVRQRIQAALVGREVALDRLLAIVDVFCSLIDDPLLEGGCPVLSTAVEADDAHPVLRERAQQAMTDWHRLIGRTVKDGLERGELRPEADPRALATLITATMEGALMLSKLYGDATHIHRAAEYLTGYLRSLALERVGNNPEVVAL
jgi:AcrR family transcriptional regulator